MSLSPIDVSLAGKSALVTGSTTGIGLEVARDLAEAGANVHLVARDAARGEAAKQNILSKNPRAKVEVFHADLSRMKDVERLAKEASQLPGLSILVNNAAAWLDARTETPEGIETMWATNVLSYYGLSAGLADALAANKPSRIVNVASAFAHGLDLDDPEFKTRPYDKRIAYPQSKQANRMMAWWFAWKLKERGITSNAVHPGTVSTDLYRAHRGVQGLIGRLYFKAFGSSAKEGADTVSFVAGNSAVHDATAEYFIKRTRANCSFRGLADITRLMELCEARYKGALG